MVRVPRKAFYALVIASLFADAAVVGEAAAIRMAFGFVEAAGLRPGPMVYEEKYFGLGIWPAALEKWKIRATHGIEWWGTGCGELFVGTVGEEGGPGSFYGIGCGDLVVNPPGIEGAPEAPESVRGEKEA